MEKRLLISVFLSLLVLYIWAGFMHKASPNKALNVSQHIDNEDVVNNYDTKPTAGSPSDKIETPINPENEELITLENDHLKVTFTNIGGTVKDLFIKGYNEHLPVTNLGGIEQFNERVFKLDKKDNRSAIFTLTNDGATIKYVYTLGEDGFTIRSEIAVLGSSEMSNHKQAEINSFTIDPGRMDIKNNNEKSLYEYAVSSYEGVLRKNNAYKFTKDNIKSSDSNVIWTAFRNRYFCVINKPEMGSKGYDIQTTPNGSLSVSVKALFEPDSEGNVNYASIFFVGPEEYDLLSSYKLGLEKVKKFYRFGLFDIIAMAIYRLMHLIYKVIPNWGVSIVLISIIIYFSMYPLTLRGMSSMKKMQALQPEITKIKDKYADNPQKMNQEMMRVYKENKINPMGGCLPFLLQMPVFIGLYQVLWRSVSFKGAKFLWIKDLSQPDRIHMLNTKLPFIGDEINLLPILMMIIMAFQQKLTSMNMNISDPIQKQQQKMMGVIMPIFLGAIFYKFASGLTLYFTLFYLFSTFTQFYMYKRKST